MARLARRDDREPDAVDTGLQARIHNERVKMQAGAANALGIALVGSAFVFPVIRDENPAALLELRTWVWISAGIGPHLPGVRSLQRLKREE